MHEKFWYQNFSETRKGSFTKSFGIVRQQIFDRESWYTLPPSLPPLTHKIFGYQKLVKH